MAELEIKFDVSTRNLFLLRTIWSGAQIILKQSYILMQIQSDEIQSPKELPKSNASMSQSDRKGESIILTDI